MEKKAATASTNCVHHGKSLIGLHPMAEAPTTNCEAEWWKGHIFYKASIACALNGNFLWPCLPVMGAGTTMWCYVYVWLKILVWDKSIQTLFETWCSILLVMIIIVNACCALTHIYIYIYMHMHISYANGPIWHFGHCLIILTHLMTKESMQCKLQGVFVTSSTEASRKLGASFSESYVVLVCFDCLSLTRDDSRWFHLRFKWFQFRSPVSVLTKWPSLAALWGKLWSDLAQWRLEGGEGGQWTSAEPILMQELILLTSMFCVAACIDIYIYHHMYLGSIYDNMIMIEQLNGDRDLKTLDNFHVEELQDNAKQIDFIMNLLCPLCPWEMLAGNKNHKYQHWDLDIKVVSCWLVARLQQSRHCIQVLHRFVLGMRFNVEKNTLD